MTKKAEDIADDSMFMRLTHHGMDYNLRMSKTELMYVNNEALIHRVSAWVYAAMSEFHGRQSPLQEENARLRAIIHEAIADRNASPDLATQMITGYWPRSFYPKGRKPQ